MRLLTAIIFFVTVLPACTSKIKVDMLVHHAIVYTVDSTFSIDEAIAVKDGRIEAVGKNDELLEKYEAKEVIDAGGKPVYPGFIDAHAHFVGYGLGLNTVDLTGTKSWEECIERIQQFLSNKRLMKGVWILGRGWDQNDWEKKDFPDKTRLDELFAGFPVLLTRVDGHAAVANQAALDLAGVKPGLKLIGGEAETKNGKLTGILIDNAIDLVSAKIPSPGENETREALLAAQQNCFAAGLTTIDDCGLNYQAVELIEKMQRDSSLKIRLYVMLSDAKENYEYIFKRGKIKTGRLNVSSFKVYADGALGSRGACLLQPYADKPGYYGFLLSNKGHFDSVASIIYEKNFQMCTHAIGDSGNRAILNIYAKYLKGKNNLRWRIEHAQVVNQNDFKLFGDNNIIPSVQPTHATSDMYWAGDRLGKEREKGAYAFKDLLKQNGWIALGTDFPVEDISPFKTFYAAVIRKDIKGFPGGGYQTENALSREEALRGMTIWAAKSNFEENEKGSIEKGKLADFIITDSDMMKCVADSILQTKVIATFLQGEKVFSR
ncbi:MAG: amidohydrolase [Chitinophagaceae bacterium]|nr:amidohydrolase [Chitinophagaceae bacterium]